MRLPKFEYAIPKSLKEACKIASEIGRDGNVIAGGTDILQALKYRLKRPGTLIDISSLSGLDKITYNARKGLVIGSLVTLRRLAVHKTVREKYPILAQAALSVGNTQLQAMGTLGGNLCQDSCCIYYNLPPVSRQGLLPCFKLGGKVCHAVKNSEFCWATYSGDMAPALLALQATVTVAGIEGEKTVSLEDIYSGKGEVSHILKPGEILVKINVPPLPHHNVGIYRKMRIRKSIDYPLLGVALNLFLDSKKNHFENILVALTAVDKSPLLIRPPERIVNSNNLDKQIDIMADAAYSKAHPIANTSGYSPRYRREMVRVYIRQGMGQAMEIASNREEED